MDALKRTRTSLKGKLTRLNTAVDNHDPNSVAGSLVRVHLSKLEEMKGDFKTVHRDIIIACADQTEIDANEKDAEGTEQKLEDLEVKLVELMAKANLRENPPAQQQQTPAPVQIQPTTLKKLDLPKFSGTYKDWPTFQDMFKAMVHDKTAYKDHEKLYYLKQALDESVPEILASTSITDANYASAWKEVQDRFDHPRLLILAQINELLELPAVKDESAKGLRFLLDGTAAVIRAMAAMNVGTAEWDPILVSLLMKKIDPESRRLWEQSLTTKDMPKYDELRQFLIRRCQALESMGHETSKKKKDCSSKKHEEVPTAADLYSGESKGMKKEECNFCEKPHRTTECRKASSMSYDERKSIMDQKKCCIVCLKTGHWSSKCFSKSSCVLCLKNHHVLLCPATAQLSLQDKQVSQENPVKSYSNGSRSPEVYLQTLLVRVKSDTKTRVVRALIDSGSQRSYILKKTAESIQMKPEGEEQIIHDLFGGVKTDVVTHKIYNVQLANLDSSFSCVIPMLDQQSLCNEVPCPSGEQLKNILKKHKIKLSDFGTGIKEVELLIGSDACGQLLLNTVGAKQLENGHVAMETKLGWIIMGKSGPVVSRAAAMTVTNMFVRDSSVTDLWNLDVLGIEDPVQVKSKEELELAVKEHFLHTVRVNEEGRYEVDLPWIEGHPPLPSNKFIAEKRLENVMKKLAKTEDFKRYDDVFQDWLKEGMIEIVPEQELGVDGHYFPHRPVIKESSSTTKVRPVFDASAHEKNKPSLNACLAKGTNLIELIPSVLTRFREKKIGLVSDIKKAFLQISVCEKDRNFLRFLWHTDGPDMEPKVLRHRRVVFGVTCSPFLLGAVIEFHLDKAPIELKDTGELLKKSFYVDNCVTSVGNMEDYEKFKIEATQLMAAGKFELRGWEHTGDQEAIQVLGMKWNKSEDTLALDLSWLPEVQKWISSDEIVISKRKILSVAHRVFDPIGVASPMTLLPKLLLQDTWETKLGWDEEVPADVAQSFKKWAKELPSLEEIKVPRWLMSEETDRSGWTIHVYTDASKEAYAACIFLRTVNDGDCCVQLIASKSRVAPKKLKGNVHRLELLGCTIGARLVVTVQKMLDCNNVPIFCWSDSSTALSWIHKEEQWSVFVRNRVKEIRDLTRSEDWRHVPGIENPADLPSRGCNAWALLNSRWWEGPTWLKKKETDWPNRSYQADDDAVNEEKLKTVTSCHVAEREQDSHKLTLFSVQFSRIVRVVAIMRHWRDIILKKNMCSVAQEPESGSPRWDSRIGSSDFSVEELTRAEDSLLHWVQQESFSGIQDSQFRSFRVQEEEGLIRVKTKLTYRQDTKNFKKPVVLPEKNSIVRMIIMNKHRELCHAGVGCVLSALRENFWILHGKRAVKNVLKDCLVCRRYDAKKFGTEPAPLPENRIRDTECFEVVGIDLAGPIYLKPFPAEEDPEDSEGHEKTGDTKAWIVLFTCAVYRAVHLELVSSLSAGKFLEAFRRFVARRGRPAIVYTDNGTNFTGAANGFKQLNWEVIRGDPRLRRIKWIFNPPTAAWWGGWWERLIGMLKNLLRRVLGQARLDFEEMSSVLCDCESVMNSRPLTYITENPEDLMALAPVMFLRDLHEDRIPEVDALTSESANRRLRYQQQLRKQLRERFRVEYLGQLVQKKGDQRLTRDIQEGEVVFIGQDNKKRQQWPTGKVVTIYPGKDGVKRTALVRTRFGEFLRPVQRLYPLELAREEEVRDIQEKLESLPISSRKNFVDSVHDIPIVTQQTRSGRIIRQPQRLNL